MSLSNPSRESFTEVPVIDLSPWYADDPDRRLALASEVGRICHHVGFFVVINHGIDPDLTTSVFDTMKRLFALPTATKQSIDKTRSRHFRGWEQVGTEFTNARRDYREQVDIWDERPVHAPDAEPAYLRMMGPNQWLDERHLPGHRNLIEQWIGQLHRVGLDLLELLSVALGLPQQHLARLFGDEPFSLTKLIHYPPSPPGEAGVNAHKDAGFLTVLAAGETPGLEVQNPEGEWIAVPSVDDGFVINLGEMLQALTGNYFVATPHRVITTQERFSAAHFLGPSLDTPLVPLPLAPRFSEAVAASARHADAGYMAQAAETKAGVADMSSNEHPDTFGEQIWNYYLRSYPAIMARHYPDQLDGC